MLERKEVDKKLVIARNAIEWIEKTSRKNKLYGLESGMEAIRNDIESWLPKEDIK